jgi:hypothetical protein
VPDLKSKCREKYTVPCMESGTKIPGDITFQEVIIKNISK